MSSLATRQPKPEEKEIIDEVLDLYQLKPSQKAYSHYSETAVFHDPVSIAKGKKSIQSQFNGMPKVFSESVTKRKCRQWICSCIINPQIRMRRTRRSSGLDNPQSHPALCVQGQQDP
jgi:hypothetical protein